MGMARGPHYSQRSTTAAPDGLAAVARAAGQRLLADLERAETLSSNWRNEGVAYALIASAMDRCLARLAATGCWGKDNLLASGELWSVAGKWLDVSWLQRRARSKPRGYAGDFEMFERFWQRQCCDHPLGRLFDQYFQSQAAVEAVRSRTEQIAAALVEHCLSRQIENRFHVASVGCGPAIDVASAVKILPDSRRQQLQVTLMDLDEAALQHASGRLDGLLAPQNVVTIRENLYRLADKPRAAAALQGADVLICSGLFDYLPDEAAVKSLRLFWDQLAAGSMLLVGNFAPHNPTRAYMEWIGNWYLIYRTAEELEQLAAAAGIPQSCFSIGAERLGINLFIVAERPKSGKGTDEK
jgi:extracellular factor (EF) 3-hydroxypalmitic acid methyl ester biosynthesis protein